MRYKLLIISLLIVVFSSCEKLMFEENGKSDDPYDNFDYLWEQCHEKYAFFAYKGIDWEHEKTVYRNCLYEGMSKDSLFSVMAAMLDELRDDHVNLVSDFNRSFYGNYRRGQDNFDWRIVADNYLPENYYVSGPFSHDFLAGDSIGYIRLSSFPGNIDGENLDFVLNRYQNTEGLIMDIRENGGGSIADVYDLLSRFVDQKTLLYYSRMKSGPGKDDFTASEPVYIEPEGGERYHKTVCLLTDRGSYSASSFTALGARAIDNVVIVGDTTGGGLGVPNGGQLPNGWTYRFSVTQTLDKNGNNYESGVPPHITALMDWSDRATDEVIERAVQEIYARR
jgi:hypothetical protein